MTAVSEMAALNRQRAHEHHLKNFPEAVNKSLTATPSSKALGDYGRKIYAAAAEVYAELAQENFAVGDPAHDEYAMGLLKTSEEYARKAGIRSLQEKVLDDIETKTLPAFREALFASESNLKLYEEAFGTKAMEFVYASVLRQP